MVDFMRPHRSNRPRGPLRRAPPGSGGATSCSGATGPAWP